MKIGELILNELLTILKESKITIYNPICHEKQLIFECDVEAKPGSKKEMIEILNGKILIKTRARPVEGEANSAIIETVAHLFGVSKSCVEIIRGDKSKSKRIKTLVEITANKNKKYFQEKFISISKAEA